MGRAFRVGILGAAVLAAGCFVEVENVKDPHAAFARARAEVARVQDRPGRPERLEVLIYDRGEGRLVRASLPLWVVREMDESDDLDLDFDLDASSDAARKVKRRLRLEDVEKAGKGVLVEVEEEGGDQVLVWLR